MRGGGWRGGEWGWCVVVFGVFYHDYLQFLVFGFQTVLNKKVK